MRTLFVLLTSLLLLNACGNKELPSSEPQWEGPNIYSVEYGSVSRFLKNGKPTNLTDGSATSKANAIFVDGDDVYVAGSYQGIGGVYWKNGIRLSVPNALELKSIYVNGNDVYVSGTSKNGASYWKNNTEYNIASNTSYDWSSSAYSIFGYNNDIYVTGMKAQNAAYWKNNNPIVLTENGIPQMASAIFVSGNDVYVAGMEAKVVSGKTLLFGKYWKNGEAVVFTGGSITLEINSIFIKNGDVYICGYEGITAKYWKNGTEVSLTDGTVLSKAYYIYVFNNDVYTAGFIDRGTYIEPAYWKNGQLIKINEVDRARNF